MSDASPVVATDARRVAVMTVLTVPAGAVDAVSFLTMGKVFCALATGNVLFLSFALAGEGDAPVARPATAIGAFIAGAAIAGVALKNNNPVSHFGVRQRRCGALRAALSGQLRHASAIVRSAPGPAVRGRPRRPH